jgi:hypothetical protein
MLINHLLEILGDKGYQGINKLHKNSQKERQKYEGSYAEGRRKNNQWGLVPTTD